MMRTIKRAFLAMIAAVLVIGMMGGTVLPVSAENVAGDVNVDGKVDLLDVLITLRLLAGNEYTGEHDKQGMFVTGDAFADLSDAVSLLRKAAGWNVELTAGNADLTITKTDGGIFYYEEALTKVLSQNIFVGTEKTVAESARTKRIERFRNLISEEYDPGVLLLQEYRFAEWFNAWEGSENSLTRTYLNYNADGTGGNSYFVEQTGESSILGSGYAGYIQGRADPLRDTKAEAKALVEANGGVATVENAMQSDERSAIFWKTEDYEPATNDNGEYIYGMFYFSDTPDQNSPHFGSETDGELTYGTYTDAETKEEKNDTYLVDNRCRIGTWIKLKNRHTLKEFYCFNIHGPNVDDNEADENGVEYAAKGAQLVADRVALVKETYGDAPVVVGGDLNADYYNPADEETYEIYNAVFDDMGEWAGDLRGTFPNWGKNVGAKQNGYAATPGFVYVRGDILFTGKADPRTVPLAYTVMEEVFDTDNTLTYQTLAEAIAAGETATDLCYASDHFGVYGEFVIWD